jgi:glycosyltransferase involved in cell wall biosynthesis
MSHSILILSPDYITERMAGPAIRYWEFAKALASSHQVTLAAPNEISPTLPLTFSAHLVQHSRDNISQLIQQHDIIIFQGYLLDYYHQLRQCDKILVSDLYDPVPLEGLERHKDLNSDNMRIIADQVRMMNTQLQLADYFLCASDRQRDLWLGHLLALGRINPLTYQEINQRVLTVPFGLPDDPPIKTGVGFRDALGLSENDFVLLWGGGIWEWFDPLTLIRAIYQLAPTYPRLKLVFLGTRHPNPTIPPMPMQERAEKLARELGLYDTHVIFQAGWVAYDQLANHLLEANVGVSAHFATLESHFSFRTRFLYYLWAEKPIIATEGDILASEVAYHKVGITVKPEDEKSWAEAIEVLYDSMKYQTYYEGIKKLSRQYRWTTVTQPLNHLCEQAQRSQDVIIEQGWRRSRTSWHGEPEILALKSQLASLEEQLDFIERSNSWKLTAPLRTLRRLLTRHKTPA